MDYGLAHAIHHAMPIAEHAEHPSALVPLKIGSGRPVFIAHGLGGSAMEFAAFARHIRSPHSIYGLRALSIDGREMAFDCIEDMAQFYLSAIQKLQQQGPYLLVGYSLGGLVMLEIAQRLLRVREKIGLLVLIDTYPHPRFLRVSQRIRLMAQLGVRHASVLRRLPVRNALRYLFDPAERLLHAALVEGHDTQSHRPATRHVSEKAYCALERYRPVRYPGTIKFIRAAVGTVFPKSAAEIWSRLAGNVEVEDVPGTHHTILTANADRLAAALSRYLQATENL